MARPNRPNWFEPRKCWKVRLGGKPVYFPRSIGKLDRPLIGGVPKAAWEYLAALQRRREGEITAATDPTIHWVIEPYLAWAEGERDADRLSAGQYNAHVTQLSRFQDFVPVGGNAPLGDLKARLLTADLADEFFDALRAEGLSDHYVANIGKSVRGCLRWAARPVKGRVPSRLLADDPLRGYRFPRPPGAVRGYVEGVVVRRFLRWAWARARGRAGLMRRFDRLFVLMLRFQRLTGCRPGEACGLRWTDIDWSAPKVVIPFSRHKTGKKTRKDRIIFLTPEAVRLLRAIAQLDDHHPEWVFTHRRVNGAIDRGQESADAGEPWPSGSAASAKLREWRDAAIAAGLVGVEGLGPKKLVAYVNRHAYVSEAVSLGLTHEQAAELVGNTAAVIGSTYAHSIESAAAERARDVASRRRGRGGSLRR